MHEAELELLAPAWTTILASTGINKIGEIIKASLLFPFTVNEEISKNENYQELLFNTDIFHDTSTFNVVQDAFHYRDIWNRAVEVADRARFGVPLLILGKYGNSQRLGLFFDHGKCA